MPKNSCVIVIQGEAGKCVRQFSINRQISNRKQGMFRFPLDAEDDAKELAVFSERAKRLIQRVVSIEGVEIVNLFPYTLIVGFGEAFPPDQIVRAVVEEISHNLQCEPRIDDQVATPYDEPDAHQPGWDDYPARDTEMQA